MLALLEPDAAPSGELAQVGDATEAVGPARSS